MRVTGPLSFVGSISVGVLLCASMRGQCNPEWLPGGAIPGIDYIANAATTWNGRMVIGGGFAIAGGLTVSNIVSWDPTSGVGGSWVPLGAGSNAGVNGVVNDLAVTPSGDLVAVGKFTGAAGVLVNRVAKWDGNNWSAFGDGLNGECEHVAVLPNGTVVVAGSFTASGSVSLERLAAWDGTSWQQVGPTLTGTIEDLVATPSNEIVVGGILSAGSPAVAGSVLSWDGNAFADLGGAQLSYCTALGIGSSGNLLAGGSGAASNDLLLERVGSTWNQVVLPQRRPLVITHTDAGELAILDDDGDVFRRSGGIWSQLGDVGDYVYALTALPGGSLGIAGAGIYQGMDSLHGAARWNGNEWQSLSTGTNGAVNAFARRPGGALIAGGAFTSMEGTPARHLAEWDGVAWSELGGGIDFAVRDVLILANGDLIVSGGSTNFGGSLSLGVARWDGQTWHPFAQGMSGVSSALLELSNGDLVAATSWAIYRRSPSATTWTQLGALLFEDIHDLAELDNGDLIAGGDIFVGAGGTHLIRWTGQQWTPFAGGLVGAQCSTLATLPNGDLIAGGRFWEAGAGLPSGAIATNGLARWDGAAWHAIAPNTDPTPARIRDIEVLADGSWLVAGRFANLGANTSSHIARYKDGAFQGFANGLGIGFALAVSASDAGEVAIGGTFYQNGEGYQNGAGGVSAYLATLRLPCPASVLESDSNCAGGGPSIVVEALPFVGSPFLSRTQLGAGDDFGVLVYGLSATNLSLQSVLPYAVAGCTVGAAPDVLELQVPSNGEVVADLVLPSVPALVGAQFWHQVIALDFSPAPSASASNTLALTVGLF